MNLERIAVLHVKLFIQTMVISFNFIIKRINANTKMNTAVDARRAARFQTGAMSIDPIGSNGNVAIPNKNMWREA